MAQEKLQAFPQGILKPLTLFGASKINLILKGGCNFLRSFRVSNSNRTHGSIKAVKEEGITDADKLNAVLATKDGAIQVLTVLSEASRYIDNLKAQIRNEKLKIEGWAEHKKAVAGIYMGCGIASGVLGIITGYYVGMACLFFIALAVVFIILMSRSAYKLSLKDYYNREAIDEIKKEEAQLEPVEQNVDPVLDLLPEGYSSTAALEYMLKMIRMGRAENFVQATKCWDEESYRRKTEAMQRAQLQSQLRTEKAAKDIRDLEALLLVNDLYRDLKYR